MIAEALKADTAARNARRDRFPWSVSNGPVDDSLAGIFRVLVISVAVSQIVLQEAGLPEPVIDFGDASQAGSVAPA
jgi:hypothetical protein